VVRVPRRDALLAYLRERGVVCKVHYKAPCYRQPVFVSLAGEDPGPRPVTDLLAQEIITLPSHPDMGDGIDYVVECLADFYG
jgi:UDP-2-acetamido-2-deoxy-ribo-hexuluronate aminotransferase